MVPVGSVLARYAGVATVVYGALAAGAFLVAWLGADQWPWRTDAALDLDWELRLLASLALGSILALVVVVATRKLVVRVQWARELHVSFRELLGPLSSREIVLFALLSGVAEELFFRGALLPTLGFWTSSLLFGALHVGPSRRFVSWTLWALAMGLAFGAIYWITGELLGCIVAHVLINHENMHFIEAHDPTDGDDRTLRTDPSLVGSRRRPRGGLMHP